jgi:transcriptional regulator with XRE-family HTH domain
MYGNRLKELRTENGWTMEEVGKKIGIKKSSYASYESKYRQPPLDKLKNLAQLYEVSVDYLIGLTNERQYACSFQSQLKQVYVKKGLHWDGREIPEEVLILLEKVLDEAKDRLSSIPDRKEG